MGFVSLSDIEQQPGSGAQQEPQSTGPQGFVPLDRERTWGEAASDTGVQLAEGVNTILGAVPNLVAPESKAAAFFRDNADFWRGRQSDPLQKKVARADEAISTAGEDGVIAQMAEASAQYFADPALAARFVVTNLPSIIPGVGAAKLSQAAALAKGATAARAAQVATTAAGATNAVLNAGGARGEAFEDIKRTLVQQGYTLQEAEELAIKDSRVVAAVGGLTGFISGKTGLEGSIVGKVGAGSAARAGGRALAAELAGEQVEEVTPKVVTNLQASRYDNRSIGKDVGRTIVETGIGSGPGAVIAGGTTGLNVLRSEAGALPTTAAARAEPASQTPTGFTPIDAAPPAAGGGAQPSAIASAAPDVGPTAPTASSDVRLAELELLAQSRELTDQERTEAQDLVRQLDETDPVDSLLPLASAPETDAEREPTETAGPALDAQPEFASDPSQATAAQEGLIQVERGTAPERVGFSPLDERDISPTAAPVEDPARQTVQGPNALTLQNRDRSRAASVAQMADIARNPDYMRLATSRTPDAGAPMVFAVGDDLLKVPAGNAGNSDVAVMSDGQRVPFRYAVVDASTVEPSNFVDGRSNPAYGANVLGTLKALNNGRTAGLRAAYQEGAAEQYRAELIADSQAHGVPVEAIVRTPNPILVRVYSEQSNTPDMAAKSQGQSLGMSPVEQAAQDSTLIDSSALAVLQPGDLASAANRDFVRAFVGRVQQSGQDVAGLMTADGTLSPAGRQRMQAALMQAAYGDAELVEELFDSLDTDVKSIGEALKAVAGEWANMRDSARLGQINPSVDITDNLVQAVGLVRRSRRDRVSLFDLTRQPDLMTGQTPDALTVGALRMFYSGSYMVRALGRDAMIAMLRDYARAAMATGVGADMFGEEVGAGQILSSFENQGDRDAQDPTQDRGRAPAGGQVAVGRADDAREAAKRLGGDEGSSGTGESGRRGGTEARPQGTDAPLSNVGASVEAGVAVGRPRTADRDFWSYAKEQGHAPKDVPVGSGLHTRLKVEFEALKAGKARVKAMTGKKLGDGWAEFAKAAGSLGVPRADMPQIKAEHRGALTQFLAARGVTHQAEVDLDSVTLRPTQTEFSTEKVKQAQDFEGGERSILISADSYVLDGHHQWLAKLAQGLPIRAIRFDAPMADLLPVVREFPSAEVSTGAAPAAGPGADQLNALRTEALPIARTGAFAKQGMAFEELDGRTAIMFKGQEIATLDGERSRQNIVKAIQAAMDAPVLTRPTAADVEAQQDRADRAANLDEQDQVRRESEAGAGLFELASEDGRQDTTGDIFNQPREEAPAPAAQGKKKPEGAATVNEDVGEQLYANRRNFTGRGMKWDDVRELNDTLKLKEVTKAKVWPRPDYEKLVADGMPPVVARLIKQVYDGLSAGPTMAAGKAPSDADLQRYIDTLSKIREGLFAFVNDRQRVAAFAQGVLGTIKRDASAIGPVSVIDLAREAMDPQGVATVLVRQVWPEEFAGAMRPFARGTTANGDLAIIGGNKALGALQFTRQDLSKWAADLGKGWPAKREAWQVQGYRVLGPDEYRLDRYDGARGTVHYIRPVQGRGSWGRSEPFAGSRFALVLDGGSFAQEFDTREAAVEAAREKVKRQAGVGQDIRGTNIEEAERTGPARRQEGEDITSQRLMDTFGFRGVNFGREGWIKQAERQAYLNQAFDGLMDLADVLGVPPKAMSLSGKLGIAFGAQGKGRFAAHFVPGYNEINLTRTKGAGTLAHEWGHGLDHHFALQAGLEKDAEPFLSEHASKGDKSDRMVFEDGRYVARKDVPTFGEGIRPEIVRAFRDIYQAMNKRNESPGEAAARRQRAQESAGRRLSQWLRVARSKIEDSPASNKADLLAEFDQHAEKLREGDTGDGYDHSGKQAFSTRVAAVRNLIKDATGRVWSLDETNGLDSAASYVRSLAGKQEADGAHEPQKVATQYKSDSRALDAEKGGKAYWSTPTEMFARAFELYVHDALAQRGQRNTFLTDAQDRSAKPAQIPDTSSATARATGAMRDLYLYPVGQERETLRASFEALVQTIESRESDDGKVTLLSRIDGPVGGGTLGALDAIAKTDDLFSLPKSDATTIEDIAADHDPEIKVRKTDLPGNETMFTLTMPDSSRATVTVRKSGRNSVYGVSARKEFTEWIAGRPGENPDAVPDGTQDVWIDVSNLRPGQNGARVYNIAATFAHNTGRIFIGDPAGLSDEAMRRRAENMLSSALKFGTTRHLAPHPRQTDGATGIGVPPLKWVYGDDIGNIERLMEVTVKALDSAFPAAQKIRYDLDSGQFLYEGADGRTRSVERRDLDRLFGRSIANATDAGNPAPEGARRFAGAGWRTVARGAVFRALLRGRGAQGDGAGRATGGGSLLEGLVRQRAQLASAAENERILYSRNLSGEAGDLPGRITFDDLQALADRIKAGAPNMPEVHVLPDPSKAPRALREYIIRQDAWYDVEGAMHDGELYLFASGLADAARAEHVLIEHEAAHYGLRAVLGPQLKTAMRLVYIQNASVRRAVAELQKRGKLSDTVATEEVIVDIPTADLARLKGWRKVVEKARDWLDSRGYTGLAERLGAWLDGTLTQQQRADLFVAELVRAARDHVKGKLPARARVGMGTRLSGTLAEDIERQEAWLQREAKARGFKDLEDLLERDYPTFEKLAELWRKRNPAESLLSRGTGKDATQTPEFKSWFGDSKVVDSSGQPLVVYHGTKRSFNEFKSGKDVGVTMGTDASAELGVFFSDDLQYVDGLLDSPDQRYKFAEGANIIPVFLALRNPKIEPMQKIQDIEDGWSSERARRYRKHLESKGHDGIIFEGKKSREFVIFRPEQAKSAIGNKGTFDPTTPDVRLSRGPNRRGQGQATQPVHASAWAQAKAKVQALTSPAAIDRLLYEFQDKLIDLRRLREHIRELGGTITDLNDAYLGEELYHKRLAKRTADFLDKELKPLLSEIRERAIGLPEFERYLHARHAPEANRLLAQRNPNRALLDSYRATAAKAVRDLETQLQRAKVQGSATKAIEESLAQARAEAAMWTGAQAFKGSEQDRLALSGMSDDDAKAFMDALDPGKRQHMADLAMLVDKMQAKTLSELEGYGLMDRATLNAWQSTYKHYVPLHRDEARPDSDRHPIGQGFSVKGSGMKSRVGSNEKVTNILAHIAMQREAALTRGEKNNVVKKLYLMAAQNPDSDFWALDAPPMIKTVDSRNGTVRTSVDPSYKHRPNVLMVRIAGRDKSIVFNEHNPSAVRLAESMKNLDIGDLHVVLGLVSKGTRWFASVNTQYNPIFGLINFARDVQAGLLNLSTTPLTGHQKEVAKHVLTAMRAIYRQRRGKASRNGRWSALWDEFEQVGGTTGYRDLFADAEDRAKALVRDIKSLDRGQVSKAAHAVVDWLSDYNEVMENAVRLSAYKVATDQGLSKEQAASLAKNLTVNFNRKGRQTRELGALYAFFNAALQGTARMVETLRGPIGKRIMFGGVALGMLNTLIGMAMMGPGDDDEPDNWEKIPEFIKERSIIIPMGREDYLTIPMPLGFHVFPNIGRLAVEFAFGEGHKSAGRRLGEMLSVLVDAFNPLGGAQNLGQMVSPTVIDPVVALMQNRDWTGRPIYREDFSGLDPTPGHTRTKDSASTVSRGLAEAINAVTGGTEYRPGAWSPTPDQLDYVFGQLTGGLGRELIKVNQTLSSAVTGDELPPYKVPLLGRLYGNTRGAAGQSEQYFENLRLVNEVENELKGRQRKGDDPEGFQRREPLTEVVDLGNQVERRIRDLRSERRAVAEKKEEGYQAVVRSLDFEIGMAMTEFNNQVVRARKDSASDGMHLGGVR